ncbi:hypothetical protein L6R52_43155, partial [Myxococcota bacterium]|nr:hypothetical protein [Myxococcota bacterium]
MASLLASLAAEDLLHDLREQRLTLLPHRLRQQGRPGRTRRKWQFELVLVRRGHGSLLPCAYGARS